MQKVVGSSPIIRFGMRANSENDGGRSSSSSAGVCHSKWAGLARPYFWGLPPPFEA